MESLSPVSFPEQETVSSFPESLSPEKRGVITQLGDLLYLTMAKKINGGETPSMFVPEGMIDPDGTLYDIAIRGDQPFTKKTQKALHVLQTHAPDFYTFVRQ